MNPDRLAHWDALSAGLRDGGIDGFLAAYGEPRVPERMRDTVITVIRQRLALHEHPDAVADALAVGAALASLRRGRRARARLRCRPRWWPPTTRPTPSTRGRWARRTPRAIPGAQLVTDEPGRSPVAWQGSQLSRVIADVAARRRTR